MEGLIHTLTLQHSNCAPELMHSMISGANPDPTACTNNTSSITVKRTFVIDKQVLKPSAGGDNVTFEVTSPNVKLTNYHFILNGITTIQNGANNQ